MDSKDSKKVPVNSSVLVDKDLRVTVQHKGHRDRTSNVHRKLSKSRTCNSVMATSRSKDSDLLTSNSVRHVRKDRVANREGPNRAAKAKSRQSRSNKQSYQ